MELGVHLCVCLSQVISETEVRTTVLLALHLSMRVRPSDSYPVEGWRENTRGRGRLEEHLESSASCLLSSLWLPSFPVQNHQCDTLWTCIWLYFLVVLLLWFLGSFQVMRLCFSHLSFISLNSPFISFILSSLSWCFILESTVSQDVSLGACFTSCNINKHTNNTHFTL